MDFDFSMDEEGKNLRQAFRARVPGLAVRIIAEDGPRARPVHDISATGFAFTDDARRYGLGQMFSVELLLGAKLFLGDLKATVRRILPEKSVIGCTFAAMSRRQEIRLDKLVLEVQKHLIEVRKARRAAE